MKNIKSVLLKFSILGIFFGVTTVGGLGLFHRYILPELTKKTKAPLILEGDLKKGHKSRGKKVKVKMKNVHFRLTNEITFNVPELTGMISPHNNSPIVNFDDVNSFKIALYNANLSLEAAVLEKLFNDIVFNYKGATLKNMKMDFIEEEVDDKVETLLKLTGEMKFVIWVSFEMKGRMTIDKTNNTMLIKAVSIKSLGNPYTKTLLAAIGLDLGSLVSVPDGRGVKIIENKIIVSPFKIFPPPALSGKLESLSMDAKNNLLYLKIASPKKLHFPKPPKGIKNYLMLKKGRVSFGKLVMYGADLIMADKDQKDVFDFYLAKYFKALTKGKAYIQSDLSLLAYLPDYNDL